MDIKPNIEDNNDWKKRNLHHIKLYNEFYRNYKHLPKEERNIIFEQIKKSNNIENKVIGIPSKHRKLHEEINGIMGKLCSVKGCGWKPLIEYNFKHNSWDKLRTTCKSCTYKKNKLNKKNYYSLTTKLRQNLNSRIKSTFFRYDKKKENLTIDYLGCSINDFKKHIESLFLDGMNWDKYGIYFDEYGKKNIGFHIDHIIPCFAFDLNNPLEVLLCFNWRNCQPLWGKENMSKGKKFDINQKMKYIEDMKNIIESENANKILKNIKEKIEKENNELKLILEKNEQTKIKQKKLYDDYIHFQCLEAIQIMFFMYENKIFDKNYKSSIVAIMKNKDSRKFGSENSLSKKLCKLSFSGDLLEIYESMNIASKSNNTFHASVSKCCSKPWKKYHSGGFHWCFEQDLFFIQHRCQFVKIHKQLLEKIPKFIEPKKQIIYHKQTDETRKKISENMKKFFETEEGKNSKKMALKKRSETINQQKELSKESIKEKECKFCNQILDISNFYKKSASKDGYQSYCKPCIYKIKKNNKD